MRLLPFKAALLAIGTTALVSLLLGLGARSAFAVPIPGLFNTGVDGSGTALSAGTNDPHFSILSPSQPAVVVKDAIPGTWIDNTSAFRWVWQDVNGLPTSVTRTFRTAFDLTGLDPATASISGLWATDNTGLDILINGASTGQTCGGFSSFCAFSVTSGFVSGANTLDFVVNDFGVISGFLIGDISGTAASDASSARVPEPATVALLGMGLAGLGAAVRRRKRR